MIDFSSTVPLAYTL
jgi:protein-disulfide isomerase